jgi:hypothetical protein
MISVSRSSDQPNDRSVPHLRDRGTRSRAPKIAPQPINQPKMSVISHSQPINQSVSQSVNQLTNKPINQLTIDLCCVWRDCRGNHGLPKSFDSLTNQPISQSVSQPTNQSINHMIEKCTKLSRTSNQWRSKTEGVS